MKRLIYFITPIFLTILIVFSILTIFLKTSGKGALQVTSRPGSKVYLNDKFIGTSPLCLCEKNNMIQSGEYTVRLVPIEGNFTEYQDRITINKGVLTVVDRKFGSSATSEGSIISLQPLDNKNAAELLVVSFPDKADVFTDTVHQGITPLSITNITNSDHTIRLKKTGYADKNLRIRTPAGYKLSATVYMAIQNGVTATSSAQEISITPNQTPTTTPTPAQTATILILQTPNGFLRVRQEAAIDSSEISRVSPGETFDLLSEENGWYNIKLNDGTSGWISSQFAQKQ